MGEGRKQGQFSSSPRVRKVIIYSRQIPNSRPTSSYVNKVNRSNSDVKASLQSELHPTKEVHEEGDFCI